GVEARGLEGGADGVQRLLELDVALAVEGRAARGRLHEAHEGAQRRGLACAVGAEEARHDARLDPEAQVVDGGRAAKTLGEGMDLDDGSGHGSTLARRAAACPPPSGGGTAVEAAEMRMSTMAGVSGSYPG